MSSISSSLSGIQDAQASLKQTARRIAQQGASPASSVKLIEARNDNAANAKAAKVAGDILKSTIDIYG